MKYRPGNFKVLLLAVGTLILVVACNSSTPQLESNKTPEKIVSNCRVIQHDGGDTEICGQLQKVVALSPPLLDILLSLGVQPAAYAEVSLLNHKVFDNPSQQIPFLGDRVTSRPINLGTRNNPSIELLLQLKPDLILGERFQAQEIYRLLSDIAPTAFFEILGEEDWKAVMQELAQALSLEEKAEQVLASYAELLRKTKYQLAPVISGQTIAVLAWQDQPFVVDGFIPTLLNDLGFQTVLSESDISSISIEAMAAIKADHILVMPTGGQEAIDDARQEWRTNPILSSIPAVKADQIYFMDYQLVRIRGPIAAEIFLNEFATQVTQ